MPRKQKHRLDDGTWIEIEEVETAASRKAKAQKARRHLGGPYSWLKQVYATARSKSDFAVALHLYRWHIVRRSRTVAVSNTELAEFGISRFSKYRSLDRLEENGFIKVDRSNRKALRVTLLKLG